MTAVHSPAKRRPLHPGTCFLVPPPPLPPQVMCVAAGTPNRLCKLADGGALQLDRLAHVVIDCQLDVKQR